MIRSYLFVPGDDLKKLDRSRASPADALIYDLEDSVGPDRKEAARTIVRDHIRAPGAGGHHKVVRVNSFPTGLTAGDLAVVMQAAPDSILLPKCEGQAELDRLGHMLDALEAREGIAAGRTKVLALVTETAPAVLVAASTRLSHPRLSAVTWGAEDLSADIGAVAKAGPDGVLDDTKLRKVLEIATGSFKTQKEAAEALQLTQTKLHRLLKKHGFIGGESE